MIYGTGAALLQEVGMSLEAFGAVYDTKHAIDCVEQDTPSKRFIGRDIIDAIDILWYLLARLVYIYAHVLFCDMLPLRHSSLHTVTMYYY